MRHITSIASHFAGTKWRGVKCSRIKCIQLSLSPVVCSNTRHSSLQCTQTLSHRTYYQHFVYCVFFLAVRSGNSRDVAVQVRFPGTRCSVGLCAWCRIKPSAHCQHFVLLPKCTSSYCPPVHPCQVTPNVQNMDCCV